MALCSVPLVQCLHFAPGCRFLWRAPPAVLQLSPHLSVEVLEDRCAGDGARQGAGSPGLAAAG